MEGTIEVIGPSTAAAVVEVSTGMPGPPGPPGPAGADGAPGPAGPAPAGTGFVKVTNGVLEIPTNDSISVGTTPAQSGAVRLAINDGGIKFKHTNGSDYNMLSVDAGGMQFGSGGIGIKSNDSFYPAGDDGFLLGHPSLRWQALNVSTSINVGTNPAQSGAIRLANSQYIKARNGANTGDVELLVITATDGLRVGPLASAQLELSISGAIFNFASTATYNVSASSIAPYATNSKDLGNAGNQWRSAHIGTSVVNTGYYEGTEMTAPAAPTTNKGRLYFEDNGSGKTRLMVRFATGAPVQVAIEP